jgi:hypothetical protein
MENVDVRTVARKGNNAAEAELRSAPARAATPPVAAADDIGSLYPLAYAGMRASGRIRPFYNQGDVEMDSDDRVAVVFLPLIEAEQEWHDAFSDPPAGG